MTKKKTVQFRLNEADRALLNQKIMDSGLSQQSFIHNAIKGTQIIPRDQLDELNQQIASFYRAIRGIATNINQMAHVANATANIPAENQLQDMQTELLAICGEVSEVWSEVKTVCKTERRQDGNFKGNQ